MTRPSEPRVEVTDEPSGGWSSVRVEHGLGGAAAHVVAVVATVGVVATDPPLELAVELVETVEALAVESRPVELLQGGALEALTHGVVVGRAGWDAVVDQAKVAQVAGEGLAGELRAVEFLTVVKPSRPVHAVNGTSGVSERCATPFLARSSRRVTLRALATERRAARISSGIW